MVLERIKEFIDYKGIAVSAFEKSIGMSNASLGKSLKTGGTIGADKLGIILNEYPEINLRWLVMGEGQMLNSDQPENVADEKPQGGNTIDRLLGIIDSQQNELRTLIGMLREKDEEIARLREELDARKGGAAINADGSSDAVAV